MRNYKYQIISEPWRVDDGEDRVRDVPEEMALVLTSFLCNWRFSVIQAVHLKTRKNRVKNKIDLKDWKILFNIVLFKLSPWSIRRQILSRRSSCRGPSGHWQDWICRLQLLPTNKISFINFTQKSFNTIQAIKS